MKKLCIAIALAGALSATTLQAAMTGVVDRGGGALWGNNGGEFQVTPNADPGWAAIGIGGAFKTFCLESTEFLNIGGTYNMAVNTAAVAGGAGGGNPDPLSKGTSWLYSQYWNGAIVISTTTAAAEFQDAIWNLEDEGGSMSTGLAAILFGKFGGDLTTWKADAVLGVSDYSVRALNLTSGTAGNTLNQDLLVVVPEPTTVLAGALLLLPFAASTIRFIRKNRAA
jgi:hypothetical protein